MHEKVGNWRKSLDKCKGGQGKFGWDITLWITPRGPEVALAGRTGGEVKYSTSGVCVYKTLHRQS